MNKRLTFSGIMATTVIMLLFVLGPGTSVQAQTLAPLQDLMKIDKPTLPEIQKAYNEYFNSLSSAKKSGWKQYKRWEYFWQKRLGKDGVFPDIMPIYNEVMKFENSQKGRLDKIQSNTWSLLGPITIPVGYGDVREQGIGRVNIVRFHPTNPNEIWIGSASGGVWKTTDGGTTWNTFPFTNFMAITISDIAISKSNPNVVYVATGDADGTPSSGGSFYSIGIIKTTDGGITWNTTGLTKELASGYLINRILVDPNNENTVIAGTQDGAYKSTDGGTKWTIKQSGNFKDLEFKPDNPDIIYASTYGHWSGNSKLWRSTDKGDTWKQSTLSSTLSQAARIAIDVVDNQNGYNNVYALVASSSDYMFNSFWVSTDAGVTFEQVADRGSAGNILGRYDGSSTDVSNGQGWYDLCIAVNPLNQEEVYTGGINIWKTSNYGVNWSRVTHWLVDPKLPYVHADHHDLEYQPGTNILFATHDGGVSKLVNNEWIDLSSGLSITQFYRIGVSQSESNVVIGGAQDNGTSVFRDGVWTHVYSGDGMDCAIDPKNPKKVYASVYNGTLMRSTDGGYTFTPMLYSSITGEEGSWVTPFIIDPNNSAVMYAGYKDIWRTSNNGVKWNSISKDFENYGTINTMAIAPSDSKVIYAATSSNIYKTSNILDWAKMSGVPASNISSMAVDPQNPDRLFITVGTYESSKKVFVYEPTKSAWTNLTGDLPNVPVNSIVYQDSTNDRLYIGTDVGVYYSEQGSGIWTKYGSGMPNIIVEDLEIHKNDKKLFAGTYSRGVWVTDLIDCNLASPTVTVSGETTFCQGDSVILTAQEGYPSYLWSNGDTTRTIVARETGDYKVTVYDNKGCNATSTSTSVTVYFVPNPKITVTGGKFPLCEGDTDQVNFTFTAPLGFSSYKWSNGDTTRKITVTQTGEYSYTGVTSDGCSATSETIYVKYHPLPDKPVISKEWLILTSTPAKTYQWYFNGEAIKGATEQSYKITKIGTYKVEITDSNECSNTSDPFEVTTDVKETPENSSIKIHPNPSTGVFNIEMNFDRSYPTMEITVRNSLGSEIFTRTYSSLNGLFYDKVDLSELASGIYFFEVKYNGKFFVLKAVKE